MDENNDQKQESGRFVKKENQKPAGQEKERGYNILISRVKQKIRIRNYEVFVMTVSGKQ